MLSALLSFAPKSFGVSQRSSCTATTARRNGTQQTSIDTVTPSKQATSVFIRRTGSGLVVNPGCCLAVTSPDARLSSAPARGPEGVDPLGGISGPDRERRRGVSSRTAHRNLDVTVGRDRLQVAHRQTRPTGIYQAGSYSASVTAGETATTANRRGVEGHACEPKGILSRWNARSGGDSGSDRGRGHSIPSSGQQSRLDSTVSVSYRAAGIKPGRRLAVVLSVLTFLSPSLSSADFLESLTVQAVPQAVDLWSTQQAIKAGGREGNPLHGNGNVLRMVAIKVPLTLGMSFLDHKIGQKSKRNQWVYRGVLVLGYAYIVRGNLKAGRRVQ